MTRDLFDPSRRARSRDRAALANGDKFLLERAFDDCLDRLTAIPGPFETALLIGCPSLEWKERLSAVAATVDIVDPGPRFAASAHGDCAIEDQHDFGAAKYDLCLAVGTLDTVNNLPLALQLIRRSLKPDAPLIGAMAGGNSLPALRAALIEADRPTGRIAMRTHPRIEAPTLAGLLGAAGFVMPVVDIDRVRLRYSHLSREIADLRAMAAGSQLADRPPALSKAAWHRAVASFAAAAQDGRTEESIEILHFAAWSPASRQAPD